MGVGVWMGWVWVWVRGVGGGREGDGVGGGVVGGNYLSLPKLQLFHHWSLRMDK